LTPLACLLWRAERRFTLKSRNNGVTRAHVAIHEGGHVAVNFALGIPVFEATILAADGGLGHARSPEVYELDTGRSSREQRRIARDAIVAAFAGPEALRMFDSAVDDGGEEDDAVAFELSQTYGVVPRSVREFGDDAHVAYLERLRREARRLVCQHWAAVELVAAALLAHDHLDQEQLEALRMHLFPEA
jgi:ATP-dependent Zn protease